MCMYVCAHLVLERDDAEQPPGEARDLLREQNIFRFDRAEPPRALGEHGVDVFELHHLAVDIRGLLDHRSEHAQERVRVGRVVRASELRKREDVAV